MAKIGIDEVMLSVMEGKEVTVKEIGHMWGQPEWKGGQCIKALVEVGAIARNYPFASLGSRRPTYSLLDESKAEEARTYRARQDKKRKKRTSRNESIWLVDWPARM